MEQKPKTTHYKYDAIVVLGAVMEWDAGHKKWKFPAIIERYAGKLVLGSYRAAAAAHIADQAPVMLVTGGSDINPETGKPESRAQELVNLITSDKYKIDKNKVEVIGRLESSHTMGNAEDVIAYLKEHPKIKNIILLCPKFQKERAELIFKRYPYFKEKGINMNWLTIYKVLTESEDIPEKSRERYKKLLDTIYATNEAKINKEMEQKGVRALRKGKYRGFSS